MKGLRVQDTLNFDGNGHKVENHRVCGAVEIVSNSIMATQEVETKTPQRMIVRAQFFNI